MKESTNHSKSIKNTNNTWRVYLRASCDDRSSDNRSTPGASVTWRRLAWPWCHTTTTIGPGWRPTINTLQTNPWRMGILKPFQSDIKVSGYCRYQSNPRPGWLYPFGRQNVMRTHRQKNKQTNTFWELENSYNTGKHQLATISSCHLRINWHRQTDRHTHTHTFVFIFIAMLNV